MACSPLLAAALLLAAPGAETRPWRSDPLYQQIAAHLATVRAIDNHTHLLDPPVSFDPTMDAIMPLGLRSTRSDFVAALRERFGVAIEKADVGTAAARGAESRKAMVARLGEAGYWNDHLDATATDIAIVNQDFREGTDGRRLRWAPQASTLLYPLPAEQLMVRSPSHRSGISGMQKKLQRFLSEDGLTEMPADLAGYAAFVDRTLGHWKDQGAVAVKFWDAYLRTIDFEDVPEQRAAALYAKGRTAPLPREEYLAVQDYLARRIFTEAGKRKLAVHIHAAHGIPPFLRTHEADVRNLDSVLTDVRHFDTQFVIIHGGAPLVEYAAYLALKPHVWYDMSAMTFLYPVPDLAQALRTVLIFAPGKLLFGTDVYGSPNLPVGADLQHVAISRAAREALALALSGLVRDGVVELDVAVKMGEDALRGNAQRLYGFAEK
jgi:hypothetical protein